MPCYIYQLPAWVLDDLCRNMDTLNEWDWMQFGEEGPAAWRRGCGGRAGGRGAAPTSGAPGPCAGRPRRARGRGLAFPVAVAAC